MSVRCVQCCTKPASGVIVWARRLRGRDRTARLAVLPRDSLRNGISASPRCMRVSHGWRELARHRAEQPRYPEVTLCSHRTDKHSKLFVAALAASFVPWRPGSTLFAGVRPARSHAGPLALPLASRACDRMPRPPGSSGLLLTLTLSGRQAPLVHGLFATRSRDASQGSRPSGCGARECGHLAVVDEGGS